MRVLILILVLFSLSLRADDTSDPIGDDYSKPTQDIHFHILPRKYATEIESEIRQAPNQQLRTAQYTDQALSQLMKVAVARLRAENFKDEAYQIESIYRIQYDGFLTKMVAGNIAAGRDIGDHKPLIAWLANVMATLERTLGFGTCKALHLTDIDVFNYAIPIVFHPCTFPMDAVTVDRQTEYREHFADSPRYGGGLIPVVVFWVADIVCSAATFGGGWFFICTPISDLAEWAMQKWIAPKLSDDIFTKSCG